MVFPIFSILGGIQHWVLSLLSHSLSHFVIKKHKIPLKPEDRLYNNHFDDCFEIIFASAVSLLSWLDTWATITCSVIIEKWCKLKPLEDIQLGENPAPGTNAEARPSPSAAGEINFGPKKIILSALLKYFPNYKKSDVRFAAYVFFRRSLMLGLRWDGDWGLEHTITPISLRCYARMGIFPQIGKWRSISPAYWWITAEIEIPGWRECCDDITPRLSVMRGVKVIRSLVKYQARVHWALRVCSV